MIRKSLAFLTLALSASFAVASPIKADHSFTNSNTYTAYSYKADQAYTNGVLVDFTLSYTVQPNKALENNDFVAIWFNQSTATEGYKGPQVGLKANCDKSCTNDLFARAGGTTGGEWFDNSNLTAGTSYHLYAYLYKSDANGEYDRLSAWLNPTAKELGNLTTGQINLDVKTGFKSFNTIGIRTANIDNGVTVNLNGLQANEVPEPGTLALMGLALAGLGFTRRNKRG